MSDLALLVAGGTLVGPTGRRRASGGVRDGRLTGLLGSECAARPASRACAPGRALPARKMTRAIATSPYIVQHGASGIAGRRLAQFDQCGHGKGRQFSRLVTLPTSSMGP